MDSLFHTIRISGSDMEMTVIKLPLEDMEDTTTSSLIVQKATFQESGMKYL